MPVVPELKALLGQFGSNPVDFATVEPEAMRRLFKMLAATEPGTPVGTVEDRAIPGPAGDVAVRIYRPEAPETAPAPVLVWYHGGGWVIGDLDASDATCRLLCDRADAVVVSVDYRLAPEHPFPAGLDDAWAALRWVAEHAASLGGDASRLAVGGESAGGNIAALMALRARDAGAPALVHQLLVYPATDLAMEQASIVDNGDGYFLTKASMDWFIDHYLGAERQHGDPLSPEASPLRVEDLAGLPSAQVVTAEYDPLRDEGDAYAGRLAAAGVPVEHLPGPGLIHGYWGMTGFSPSAAELVEVAAAGLRDALHPG